MSSASSRRTQSTSAGRNFLIRPEVGRARAAVEHQVAQLGCRRLFGELSSALLSALLLILAFPDFDLWPLAWVALDIWGAAALVLAYRSRLQERAGQPHPAAHRWFPQPPSPK